MSTKLFKLTDSIFDITKKYPETIDTFVKNGFEMMADEKMRESLGKSLTLSQALSSKKINQNDFFELLNDRINLYRNVEDVTMREGGDKKEIHIEGLLPCPVRTPLLETLDKFITKKELSVSYDLKAASMGLDWLMDKLKDDDNADNLADIFISAGFDLFFDNRLMGKFKDKGIFKDALPYRNLNSDFQNDYIDLRDPKAHYSIISVVPAIFLVNTEELNGRKMPETWEDILKPEFENSVSLPVGDFDLFNAILLNIEKNYGEEGVKKLGKCLLENMHPSQMVKSHLKKVNKPIITIMPYFFSKMAKEGGVLKMVWPKDGAILSPIFLLTKEKSLTKTEEIVNKLASKEIGEILAHNGLFPSTSPDVDNRLSKDNKYMWIGWDYIYSNNLGENIDRCNQIFNDTIKEV